MYYDPINKKRQLYSTYDSTIFYFIPHYVSHLDIQLASSHALRRLHTNYIHINDISRRVMKNSLKKELKYSMISNEFQG